MKKIIMMALFAVAALGAKAQGNVTIWWGGTVANVTDFDSKFEPLNLGVTYTAPIDDAFDWSVGAGYTTKGGKKTVAGTDFKWAPGMIQLEANGAWNFVKTGDLKANIFTGPYVGFIVSKDTDDADKVTNALGTEKITNTVDFGWQGGLGLTYKFISLKAGYEFGFTNLIKSDYSKLIGKDKTQNGNFYFRVGFTF